MRLGEKRDEGRRGKSWTEEVGSRFERKHFPNCPRKLEGELKEQPPHPPPPLQIEATSIFHFPFLTHMNTRLRSAYYATNTMCCSSKQDSWMPGDGPEAVQICFTPLCFVFFRKARWLLIQTAKKIHSVCETPEWLRGSEQRRPDLRF